MRVLVVEDEPKIAHAIKRGLERESYAVDVVYDGTEGYDLASIEKFFLMMQHCGLTQLFLLLSLQPYL